MRNRRDSPVQRTTITVPTGSGTFARTLERQIEEIMSQVAPRRQSTGRESSVVSALFVTIKGFVALCEQQDPTSVASVLDIYLETLADSVGKFLGTVHNTLGGTLVASWNAEYPQADHALLAVNSALDMIERIDDIQQRLRVSSLPPITFGIGVNTGAAVLAPPGFPRKAADLIGDTVNVARLLAEAATAGAILVGQGTEVSVSGDMILEALEPTMLPGKSEPTRVFRVIGRAASG